MYAQRLHLETTAGRPLPDPSYSRASTACISDGALLTSFLLTTTASRRQSGLVDKPVSSARDSPSCPIAGADYIKGLLVA